MIYFGYLEGKANVIIFPVLQHSALLHSPTACWRSPSPPQPCPRLSPLFFFTNLTPVRLTYPFPPLFATCLSRLTLSFHAKPADVPFPAFLTLCLPQYQNIKSPTEPCLAPPLLPSLKEAFLLPEPLGSVNPAATSTAAKPGHWPGLRTWHPSSLCWLALG